MHIMALGVTCLPHKCKDKNHSPNIWFCCVTQQSFSRPSSCAAAQDTSRMTSVPAINVSVILCPQVFHANTDATEVVLNRIPHPILARFVRIRPQTWNNGIALRFELYGCQITGRNDWAFLRPSLISDLLTSTSDQKVDQSKNISEETSSGKEEAKVLGYFSLCEYNLMINNSENLPIHQSYL